MIIIIIVGILIISYLQSTRRVQAVDAIMLLFDYKGWPGEFLLPWLQTLFSPLIPAQILKVIPVMKSSGNSVFKNDQDVEDWWNIKGQMIQKPKSRKNNHSEYGNCISWLDFIC